MTEEKYEEIKEKILKAVQNESHDGIADRYREIALDYAEMINELITPMNRLTAPLVAALEYIQSAVLEVLDSDQRKAAETTEMFLKLTTRTEKYDIK